jgi:hypothetical protein
MGTRDPLLAKQELQRERRGMRELEQGFGMRPRFASPISAPQLSAPQTIALSVAFFAVGWIVVYSRPEMYPAPVPAAVSPRPPPTQEPSAFVGSFVDGEEAYRRGDYETAVRILRPLAERGDTDAQNEIGKMYESGQGVPMDNAQAARWYRSAAGQGSLEALDRLKVIAQRENRRPPCPASLSSVLWNNCEGEFTFSDGTKYVGGFLDRKMHGRGAITFADGQTYTGEFRYGSISGRGTLTGNGFQYTGEFSHGKFNGQGNLVVEGGDNYMGSFRDGKMTGHGSITFRNGDIYVGDVRDGKMNGRGTLITSNGAKYDGQFKDNKFLKKTR